MVCISPYVPIYICIYHTQREGVHSQVAKEKQTTNKSETFFFLPLEACCKWLERRHFKHMMIINTKLPLQPVCCGDSDCVSIWMQHHLTRLISGNLNMSVSSEEVLLILVLPENLVF